MTPTTYQGEQVEREHEVLDALAAPVHVRSLSHGEIEFLWESNLYTKLTTNGQRSLDNSTQSVATNQSNKQKENASYNATVRHDEHLLNCLGQSRGHVLEHLNVHRWPDALVQMAPVLFE